MAKPTNYEETPLPVFRFGVEFTERVLASKSKSNPGARFSAAFSECTGLEVTMEPKVIKEGGRNYGSAQRAGPVSFATVILKRGIMSSDFPWKWFAFVTAAGNYAHRMDVKITLRDAGNADHIAWTLEQALPIKFKTPDLNATSSEVGIEELHLVHEGLTVKYVFDPFAGSLEA